VFREYQGLVQIGKAEFARHSHSAREVRRVFFYDPVLYHGKK
jgi:hypothetical protein